MMGAKSRNDSQLDDGNLLQFQYDDPYWRGRRRSPRAACAVHRTRARRVASAISEARA